MWLVQSTGSFLTFRRACDLNNLEGILNIQAEIWLWRSTGTFLTFRCIWFIRGFYSLVVVWFKCRVFGECRSVQFRLVAALVHSFGLPCFFVVFFCAPFLLPSICVPWFLHKCMVFDILMHMLYTCWQINIMGSCFGSSCCKSEYQLVFFSYCTSLPCWLPELLTDQ